MAAQERIVQQPIGFKPAQLTALREFAGQRRWSISEAVREAVDRMLAQDSQETAQQG